MVSRSQPTIWLALPGGRPLERSFRLQATWQSLPKMLQVTGGEEGSSCGATEPFFFPFTFRNQVHEAAVPIAGALQASGFGKIALARFLLRPILGYKAYETKAKAESVCLPWCNPAVVSTLMY